MKNMLNDDNISTNLETSLKEELTKEVNDLITWLDNNPNEEKELYDSKKNEFQEKMKPILSKGIPAGMQPDMSGENDTTGQNDTSGPNIEEVD